MPEFNRRAAILGQSGKLNHEPGTLPGPDGPVDVLVYELMASEAREFETAVGKNAPNLVGFLLQLVLRDPDTKERLFEVGDREQLETLGMAGLRPLLETAARLSGLDEADMAKARASLASGPSNGSIS